MGHRGEDKIAARGMHNAFGGACRAGGVEDKQRILGVHFFRRAICVDLFGFFMQPVIKTITPRDLIACALHHKAFHFVEVIEQRLIDVVFQLGHAATARGSICGDDQLGITAVDARAKGIGRKARKHDGMDRADARACQHGVGGFRDHRKIEDHAIPASDAQALEHIGHFAGLCVQLFVGDVLRGFIWVIGFPNDRCLIAARGQVAVNTVGGNVQGAVFKPLDGDIAKVIADVFDFGEWFDPVDPARFVGPEAIGIGDRGRVHVIVLGLIDVSHFDHGCGGGVGLVRHRYSCPKCSVLAPPTHGCRDRGLLRWRGIPRATLRFRGLLRQSHQTRWSPCRGSRRGRPVPGRELRFAQR